MAPKITLYRADGSCSLASHALLAYTGLPFTSVPMKATVGSGLLAGKIAPVDGSLTHEEYRAKVHPHGYVPALQVEEEAADGSGVRTTTPITESPAILTYIAGLAAAESGGPQLIPQDVKQRAKLFEWLSFLSGTLHGRGYGMWFRPARFMPDDGPGPLGAETRVLARETIVAGGEVFIKECYEEIEERLVRGLGEGSYAVGDALTPADFYLFVFYRWGLRHLKIPMQDVYPTWAALMRRVEGLDAVQKTMQIEKLELCFSH